MHDKCLQFNVRDHFWLLIVHREVVLFYSTAQSSPGSPEKVEVDVDQKAKRHVILNSVTTILAPLEKTSPCASNESLTIDHSRFVYFVFYVPIKFRCLKFI